MRPALPNTMHLVFIHSFVVFWLTILIIGDFSSGLDIKIAMINKDTTIATDFSFLFLALGHFGVAKWGFQLYLEFLRVPFLSILATTVLFFWRTVLYAKCARDPGSVVFVDGKVDGFFLVGRLVGFALGSAFAGVSFAFLGVGTFLALSPRPPRARGAAAAAPAAPSPAASDAGSIDGW